MSNHSKYFLKKEPVAFKAIFQAGLIAGILDGIVAIVLFLNGSGDSLILVFNYIARGLLKGSVLNGEVMVTLSGMALHFGIAFAFAVLFYLVYPQVKRLKFNPVISGILYGIFVWFVMNLVVFRLSGIPQFPLNITNCLIGIMVFMLFTGIPISLTIDRYYTASKA